jgi:hypothetical protein
MQADPSTESSWLPTMVRPHGSGCRFELDSGELVDFDLSVNDEGLFDEFRLQSFVKSRSEE